VGQAGIGVGTHAHAAWTGGFDRVRTKLPSQAKDSCHAARIRTAWFFYVRTLTQRAGTNWLKLGSSKSRFTAETRRRREDMSDESTRISTNKPNRGLVFGFVLIRVDSWTSSFQLLRISAVK
jgi:hypothetical protein